MNTQIAIIYENVKYFTFYGSEYLQSKFPNTNVIAMGDIVANTSYAFDLNKHSGGTKWQQIPVLEDAKVTRVGSYLQGTGTITVKGVTYDVELTPNKLLVTEQGASASIESVQEEPTPVVEQVEEKVEEPKAEEPTPTPVEEPVVEEPVVEEVKEPVIEEKPLSKPVLRIDVPAEVLAKAQPAVAPVLNVPTTQPVKPAPTMGVLSGSRWGSNKGTRPKLGLSIGTSATHSGLVFHGDMPTPNVSEGFRNRRLKNITATGRPNEYSSGRRLFNKQLQQPMQMPMQPVVPEPPKPTAAEIEAQKEKELMDAWHKAQFHERVAKFEQPVPETVSEEVVEVKALTPSTPTEVDSRKAAKEALRSELPAEVNAVIGKIPLELLKSIPEFTANPVDVQQLNSLGDVFCIDNRWHRQGKWFCVDVVCTKSRYFFNSKLGVSIDIPIDICRKWLDVIVS